MNNPKCECKFTLWVVHGFVYFGKSRGNFQSFVRLYFSLDTDITDNFE